MNPAGEIEEGQFFRKSTGKYVYLRISESARTYYRLTPGIYGVCYNGNMTLLDPEAMVVRCSVDDFIKNIATDNDWHDTVGVDPKERREMSNHFHEDFEIGQRVLVKENHLPGGFNLTGEIAGVSATLMFVVYIILLDAPHTPTGYTKPWKAITMPGQALERI